MQQKLAHAHAAARKLDVRPSISAEHARSADAGQEIYLRWPSRYHLQESEPTSFGQIEELCRMKSETAIGYITEVSICCA